MDLEELEALALAQDRAAALARLVPGTAEHDYWRGVLLQHQGDLDAVDAILAAWQRRHGRTGPDHARLARRQLLLRAGRDLEAHAENLRFHAGVRLDDEAEAVVAAQRYPTALDPKLLAEAALVREAIRRSDDLSYVTEWALGDLLSKGGLDATRRRHLLQRLTRADLPGTVDAIAADLGERSSRGFGSLPVHGRLTLDQLHELAQRRPEVRKTTAWVAAVITRLRPPPHIDWQHDPDARAAYLAELWAFVDALPPSFGGLRAAVLYHQLDLDRRRGRYDRDRLRRYLALPRRVRYAAEARLKDVHPEHLIDLTSDAAQAAGLPAIGDDEALVREHLAHHLTTDEGADLADLVRADWLAELLAQTRLLAGDPDPDRWAALLGPAKVAALQALALVELTVRNPARVAEGAPVVLEVDVKNVPALVVKVFRVDPVAYFLARGAAVDTSVDLDGLVASDEQVIRPEAPPIRRLRHQIPLSACDRPGTYVVEIIGGGTSSRALIFKGSLRHTLRVGAAGPTLRVHDEAGRPLDDARVWLGGREYAPRPDGAISIPFSTAPGRTTMLLVAGPIAQVEALHHPAESYRFSAGLHLERESLVPGRVARVLVRPALTCAEWPATVALIDDPRVELTVTDRAGTTTSRTQPLALRDDAESLVELHVPEEAASIAVAVRGRVFVASTQQWQDLVDGEGATFGAIHTTAQTEALHLVRSAQGHALDLLGKTGEPRPGRALSLTFKHVAVGFEITTTLETDARGRIDLGELAGVERLSVVLPGGAAQAWDLWPEAPTQPRARNLSQGTPLLLPLPAGVPVDAPRRALALLELRAGVPARDRSAHLAVRGRALEVAADLPAGDYLLLARGAPDLRLVVAPADAPIADGWALAGPIAVELGPDAPVLTDITQDPDHLTLHLAGAGPATRVHLIATRYRPHRALTRTLHRGARHPRVTTVPPVLSHYVSGRDLGDEYRYVLDRQGQPRRPGVLLDKPGLLLNPWALRSTRSTVQQARSGGAYAPSPSRPPAAPTSAAAAAMAQGLVESADFAALDFLPAPAIVLPNLRADDHGQLRVPRRDLGDAQHLRVILVDPAITSVADLPLAPTPLRPRDLRLRLALAHEGHFREERAAQGAPQGARLVVDDVRSGKLELVDTTARALQVLISLGAPDTLREFAFLGEWHALTEPARRARYSKYACHELHLFLHFRDPAFFDRVVRPYLAHKRRKTFVDRWLLGDDLADYADPWALGRLNALELVLLGRRRPELHPAIARLLGDRVDLIPPDPERDARLVDTLLGATALEGGGGYGGAAAAELADDEAPLDLAAEPAPKAKKRARLQREEEADAFTAAPEPIALGGAPPPPPAAKPMAPGASPRPAPPAPARRRGGADLDGAIVNADLEERRRAAPLYRGADKTQEWAESEWWHVRVQDAGPALIPIGRFWRDLAVHDPAAGPFLSPHLGECIQSLAAALCALAVLDLPFVAGQHAVEQDDARLTLTCATPALAARTRIVEAAPSDSRSPILVGQSYFRADDRWEWDGAEQREKYVDGELLVGVVYQCQVVVTNPQSRAQKLAVLLQIPRGAVPVESGFYTRTVHWHLGPYGTQSIDYAFYFPAAGHAPHFPAHVTRQDELVAFAEPRVLEVVETPTIVDTTSWAHISQHGALGEVLDFLARANLGRVDLSRIAWRMKDPGAFRQVLDLLAARHTYDDRLWAYALRHADRRRVAEWLRHQDPFVRVAGPALQGALIDLDPEDRGWYEHLEYAPLINARAHQLGARRQILSEALDQHYRAFLDVVAHRPAPTDDDLLVAAHYLFCLDRQGDALAALARVDASRVPPLPHDYLAAYAACCRGDLALARRLAAPWADHPVDRWRSRYAALLAMLDEAEGHGPAAAVDAESRDQRMNELAAAQPALDLKAEAGALVLHHANLESCELRFYRMDIELLFSREPFVQGDTARFSWIEPGARERLAFTGPGRTPLTIPPAMRGQNLVIEAVAPGLRRSVTHYSHDLALQPAHHYGQLRVLRASTQAAIPAAYVKVYARMRGGGVQFFKDGYTDLRGRFDYATLSTDDLDRVERFAILVVADDAGATVLEAPPPPR